MLVRYVTEYLIFIEILALDLFVSEWWKLRSGNWAKHGSWRIILDY